jgi:hypothetical protein
MEYLDPEGGVGLTEKQENLTQGIVIGASMDFSLREKRLK